MFIHFIPGYYSSTYPASPSASVSTPLDICSELPDPLEAPAATTGVLNLRKKRTLSHSSSEEGSVKKSHDHGASNDLRDPNRREWEISACQPTVGRLQNDTTIRSSNRGVSTDSGASNGGTSNIHRNNSSHSDKCGPSNKKVNSYPTSSCSSVGTNESCDSSHHSLGASSMASSSNCHHSNSGTLAQDNSSCSNSQIDKKTHHQHHHPNNDPTPSRHGNQSGLRDYICDMMSQSGSDRTHPASSATATFTTSTEISRDDSANSHSNFASPDNFVLNADPSIVAYSLGSGMRVKSRRPTATVTRAAAATSPEIETETQMVENMRLESSPDNGRSLGASVGEEEGPLAVSLGNILGDTSHIEVVETEPQIAQVIEDEDSDIEVLSVVPPRYKLFKALVEMK